MTNENHELIDILVVGAGPSGSLVSTLLKRAGMDVLVIEKQKFPRFSIGESLLPQSMVYLEEAGMLEVVKEACYQHKNGAAFRKNEKYSEFNFEKKFSNGPGTTYQVKRADFDKRLADCASEQGVDIRYQHQVMQIEEQENGCDVDIIDDVGKPYKVRCKFLLDASGFGRVLPRLLDLEIPSDFPVRKSIFCHIQDNIEFENFDRNKILISVHPTNKEIWYWLIPFSDGTCSLGVVAKPEILDNVPGDSKAKLESFWAQEPGLKKLLSNAKITNEVQEIKGYSANVKTLYGKHFALLGNAGEFLDPVFSSGMTIAFKSASLAASVLIRKNSREEVCWKTEYSDPLMKGVDTFRVFVEAWYDGRLQDVIFYKNSEKGVREMICSILAGYAWDEENPYVAKPLRRLNALANICNS